MGAEFEMCGGIVKQFLSAGEMYSMRTVIVLRFDTWKLIDFAKNIMLDSWENKCMHWCGS